MKADVKATANAMSTNTIMVYASAPSFPHGVIDPVEKLAQLTTRYGVRDCSSNTTHSSGYFGVVVAAAAAILLWSWLVYVRMTLG